jgi:HicB family
MLRVPPEVHGAALVAAQVKGISSNQWATNALRDAVHASSGGAHLDAINFIAANALFYWVIGHFIKNNATVAPRGWWLHHREFKPILVCYAYK